MDGWKHLYLSIPAIFIVMGAPLTLIGMSEMVPFGNPQPEITNPIDLGLLKFGGLGLVVIGVVLGVMYALKHIREPKDTKPEGRELAITLSNQSADVLAQMVIQRLRSQKPIMMYRPRPQVSMPSIFKRRQEHWLKEKAFLAEIFTPLLLNRCHRYIRDKFKVYLLIDSGTTLYPFFTTLGQQTASAHARQAKWLENFEIVTNNVEGVLELMRVGRKSQYERHADLAVTCTVLPGTPLPAYSALTGIHTTNAIQGLKQAAGQNAKFIVLTTGNWVRIMRNPPCPVPLARNDEHLKIKETLIQAADEVYVVTPLGKVFFDVSPKELNKILGFIDNEDGDKLAYKKAEITSETAHRVKMVSTSRRPRHVLSRHSDWVQSSLNFNQSRHNRVIAEFDTVSTDQIDHLLFPFDALPNEAQAQFEVEFPHAHTRTNAEFCAMFHVDPADPLGLNPPNQ